jgi:hypothetical protein
MQLVTAKEKLLERAPRWSEEQAARAIRAAEGAPGDTVDEWGNLDAWGDAVGKGAFDELDKQEAAIGFSWETHRRA